MNASILKVIEFSANFKTVVTDASFECKFYECVGVKVLGIYDIHIYIVSPRHRSHIIGCLILLCLLSQYTIKLFIVIK